MMNEVRKNPINLTLTILGLIISVAALIQESVATALVAFVLLAVSLGAIFFLSRSSDKLNETDRSLEETNRSLKETNRALEEKNRALEEARSFLEEPPFTLLSVDKTPSFNEENPHVATHVDIRDARANYKGLTELWFKEIGPDSLVENVLIDGEVPDYGYIEEGKKSVCRRYPFKHYPDGLKWREELKSTLTLDIVGAFPDEREYYTHKVMDKTEKLFMRIRFHRDKRPYNVKAYKGAGGPPWEEIKPSPITNHGTEYVLTLENPEWGKHYRIQWEW